MPAATLRPYQPRDEDAAIALWLRTWQPPIRSSISPSGSTGGASAGATSLLPAAEVVVAEADGGDDRLRHRRSAHALSRSDRGGAGALALGVGAALIAEAKRISPAGLDLDVNIDNARAIGFYRRLGFLITGAGKNPISGKPVHRMSWRP